MNKTNKMVILGDMLELGEESAKEHETIVKLLDEKNITNVILVGPHFKKAGSKMNAITFETSEDALSYLKQHAVKQCTVLIKGSRGVKLEKLVDAL